MNTHKKVLTDLQAILETASLVGKTVIGPPQPLASEDTFSAVYIMPTSEVLKTAVNSSSIAGYDDYFLVRLVLNVNNTESTLHFTEVRDQVIRAVLQDTQIWDQIIDRDVVSVVYDEFGLMPLSSLEIVFEFRFREVCSS